MLRYSLAMRRLALLLLCLPALAAAGEIHRWVDAQGRVHYTQTPPPGAKTERQREAPAVGSSPAQAAIQGYNAEASKVAEARAKATAKQEAEAQRRAELCQRAQTNLATLENRPPNRVMTVDAEGQRSRMDEQQYNTALAESRAVASKNCGS